MIKLESTKNFFSLNFYCKEFVVVCITYNFLFMRNLSIVLLSVISYFPWLKFIITWINQLITWLDLNIKLKKKKITLVLLNWLILLCNDFIRFTLCMQSYSRAMMNITLGKHCLFSIGFRHSLRNISYNTPSDSKKKKKVWIYKFFSWIFLLHFDN